MIVTGVVPYTVWSDENKVKTLDYIYKVMSNTILFSDDGRPIKGTSKKDVYFFVMLLQEILGTNKLY